MVRDNLESFVGCHQRVPTLLCLRQARVEVGVARREIGGIGRVQLRQPLLDRFGDAAAQRVHVAHGARDLACRDLENARRERGVEVAGRIHLDLGVAALLDERRQPTDLELTTH